MTLKTEYIDHLRAEYPDLSSAPMEDLISDNLLSPYKIKLPKKILNQAQEAISAMFHLRESQKYQKVLLDRHSDLQLSDPGNKSIMMSYDFHLDANQNLKLIEVNTNAAFLVLGYHLYKVRKIPQPISDFSFSDLKNCILEELQLNGKTLSNPKVAILDESPSQQRLFVEFLVTQSLMKSWGWKCDIRDVLEATNEPIPDFIYNRFTDFYFSSPSSSNLRNCFLDKDICFSPNPFEYFLLADKNRLNDWSSDQFRAEVNLPEIFYAIDKVLLKSQKMTAANKEQLWANKKGLFFKPSQDFGSKGSFKGASISRKVFDDFFEKDSLAQEYVSAPEVSLETATGPQNFKYDLRFYTYKDRLQSVIARLYQGQTTNLRTVGGGFTCIEFF